MPSRLFSKAPVQGWAKKISVTRKSSGSGNPVTHSRIANAPKGVAVRLEFARLFGAHKNYLRSTKNVSQRIKESESTIRKRAMASVEAVYKKRK